MPNDLRVAQFMPFDSLKGFKEAIKEKERVVVDIKELSPDLEEDIDYKLHQINVSDMVSIVYLKKNVYLKAEGIISKINIEEKYIQIVKEKISFNSIYKIEKLN